MKNFKIFSLWIMFGLIGAVFNGIEAKKLCLDLIGCGDFTRASGSKKYTTIKIKSDLKDSVHYKIIGYFVEILEPAGGGDRVIHRAKIKPGATRKVSIYRHYQSSNGFVYPKPNGIFIHYTYKGKNWVVDTGDDMGTNIYKKASYKLTGGK